MKVAIGPGEKLYLPIITELVVASGVTPTYLTVPPARALEMLRLRQVDAELAHQAAAYKDFKDDVILVGPIACSELGAFVRKDSTIRIDSVRDIENYSIGYAETDQSASEFISQLNVKSIKAFQRESMMPMLEAKRFDVAIAGIATQLAVLATSPELKLKIERRGPVLKTFPLYIAVSDKHPAWARKLQTAIDQAIKSGSWQTSIKDVHLTVGLPADTLQSCLKRPGAPN